MQEDRDLLWYSAYGSSMFPFIRGGDFILVKRVPLNTITPGDTIVFESEDKKKVCHNVAKIKITEDVLWFYSKGHKSITYDSAPIRQDKVLGKAIALRRKNKVIDISGEDIHSFRFHFECLLAESIFYIRGAMAKIPWLKKIYKSTIGKRNFV